VSERLMALAGAPIARREFPLAPEPMIPPGTPSMQRQGSGFAALDTMDPAALFSLRAGIGQTEPETSRLYQLASDTALNFAGTTPLNRLTQAEQAALRQTMVQKYPEIRSFFGQAPGGHLYLSELRVLPEARNQGLGSAFMRDLVAEADARGLPMSLTPDGEWGGNVRRLREFYRRFGFEPNRGRGRDLTTYETMVRPAKPTP
jgi:GNAT superfamily N-acetyltransferase